MADDQVQEQQELFRQAVEPPAQVAPPSETPAAETPPPAAPPTPPAEAEAAIPSWRLREEADARRAAEDRARTLEERLNQVLGHVQQSEAAKKAPDFFENPTQATQAVVIELLKPFAQEIVRQNEGTRLTLMAMGRMVASAAHGAESVDSAEAAFLKAVEAKSLDKADYDAVVDSPNRYDAVVRWHRRQSTLAAVGDDPTAWFEKQLETRMADPQFQAKLLEKVRADASARPSQTRLPPSLSRTPAAAPNRDGVGGTDDASLFAYAMGAGRKE